jgi:hypothetical protein
MNSEKINTYRAQISEQLDVSNGVESVVLPFFEIGPDERVLLKRESAT